VGGVSLTAVASIVHAGALVLAPVAVVQPIGVLSVPFAVVLAASRTRIRPPAVVWAAIAVCLVAVVGFVVLADIGLGTSPAPRFLDVLVAALGTGALAGGLALWAVRRSGWLRCAGFAAAGATAFGLVSALMRLIALHLTSGVNDLDDVGVWLPAVGIALALVGGGWSVQQAHAAGAPAVVVGCLTVIDPLVAVGLGIAMLGEGTGTTLATGGGLIAFALAGLGAALLLARFHPDSEHAPSLSG
jgi:drug/metabolite transporter (DMT)-like permease